MTKMDGEIIHDVCGKVEHPEYNNRTKLHNDIAILHLCEPIMFSTGFKFFQSQFYNLMLAVF